MRLKQEHLNIAKFEPENGLDPMLDLVLVGSEWQFRIQSRASKWQDKLVVTSTRPVEQDAISPLEVTFSNQISSSIFQEMINPTGIKRQLLPPLYFFSTYSLHLLFLLF